MKKYLGWFLILLVTLTISTAAKAEDVESSNTSSVETEASVNTGAKIIPVPRMINTDARVKAQADLKLKRETVQVENKEKREAVRTEMQEKREIIFS